MRSSELAVFGANLYLHDFGDQQSALARFVVPWASPRFASGDLPFFVYDHYDARGPHLALFFATPAPRREALAAELAGCLAAALAAMQSGGGAAAALSLEDLETRHAACRGRAQNPADREPGFAPAGSFRAFSQNADHYPFSLGAEAADGDAFLGHWREICRTTAARMNGDPIPDWRGAIGLVATLGRALAAEGKDPAALWRRDAGALLPILPSRLAAGGEQAAFASVADLISAKNAAAFDGLWGEELPGALSLGELRCLVRAAAGTGWGDGHPALKPLRELLHCALKGLGIAVIQQIPLVLHAWRKALNADRPSQH